MEEFKIPPLPISPSLAFKRIAGAGGQKSVIEYHVMDVHVLQEFRESYNNKD